MPARYPPIDRLPPIQVRHDETDDAVLTESRAATPAAPGRARRAPGTGSRWAHLSRASGGSPLAGRLPGLDALRGATFLLFAWAVLLPVPLGRLLGDGTTAAGTPGPWSGPASALHAGFQPRSAADAWAAGQADLIPSLLFASVLFAVGAGVPLAAARRSGEAGGANVFARGFGLLLSLPVRFATLVLVAVLVPVMRPETLGTGPSAALALLGLLGLIPLTVRFGPEVTRAGRWTLRAGGLAICLLVLVLRLDVTETRVEAWSPDPVVLAIAWNGLLAALLWLVTPGRNVAVRGLRLAVAFAVACWFTWLPWAVGLVGQGVEGAAAPTGEAVFRGGPLHAWFNPYWLLGFGVTVVGTIVGDFGVRHLRDLVPPPPGALPRVDHKEVRWGGGAVALMTVLLLVTPAAALTLAETLAGLLADVPVVGSLGAETLATIIAFCGVVLARVLMIGHADASGRWTRSLTTFAATLLAGAVLLGVADGLLAGSVGGGEAAADTSPLWLTAAVLALWLGTAGGLSAILAGLAALLDRPGHPLPLHLASPVTGVGRSPLLLYLLLAGPVIVLFGYPWVPVAPAGAAATASVDTWAAWAIESLWGPDASVIHGVGYAFFKMLVIALPVTLLARLGIVLRA